MEGTSETRRVDLVDGGSSAGVGSVATELIAASTLAITSAGLSLALAALLFSGPLSPGLGRATTAFVLGGGLVTLAVGLFGRAQQAVAITQDGPVIVMAAAAGHIVAAGSLNPVRDVVIAIALVTTISGVGMLLIARFGLSSAVRFLPRTVVGGFVAGTGWLLFKGGFDVMLDGSAVPVGVTSFFTTSTMLRWLPGLLLGLLLVGIGRLSRVPPAATGVVMVVGCVLFYGVGLSVMTLDELAADGWLIGSSTTDSGFRPLGPADVGGVGWSSLADSAGPLLTVIGVSLVALLLNLSGLERVLDKRIDLDAELKVAGWANLAIAPLGCSAGFHGLGDTSLGIRLGAKSRWMTSACGVLTIAIGVAGIAWVGRFPRMMAGALLIVVGLGLLADWLRSLSTATSRAEQFLSVGVLAMIGLVGILEGIVVGVVAACAIFVARYSRIDPVRVESSGLGLMSRVDRTSEEREHLAEHGAGLRVFELHGYLFFGSVARVAERVRGCSDNSELPLHTIVIDFAEVTGIDSSGFALLGELADIADASAARLVLSGLSAPTLAAIERAEPDLYDTMTLADDLDAALEVAEEGVLRTASSSSSLTAPIDRAAGRNRSAPAFSPELVNVFDCRAFAADEVLTAAGDPSDVLFVVTSGELRATTVDEHGTEHRLRRFGAGALVGEIGFLANSPRTATVVAIDEVTVLALTRPSYERLRADRPDLALELQDYILAGQAERAISLSNNLARALR